ncbi:MAG: triose-phosphate isomerase [Deltaproteobacteria bacterium]
MTSRVPLIAGNWKMYKTGDEAVETARRLLNLVKDVTERDIMIAPPFTALAPVAQVVAGTPVGLGAQNLYWEKEGAFTGEISPGMLKAAGCRYVILGHSERRQFFGETDEGVNRKIAAANSQGLVPVFCIGESEQERESDLTFSVLDKQVRSGLQGFALEALEKLVIAYEPVWAIGTGKTATSAQAQEVHGFVRSLLEKMYGEAFAQSIRILYGGSVKPGNIAELMGMPDIDGALVGGASLDAETFSKIVCY